MQYGYLIQSGVDYGSIFRKNIRKNRCNLRYFKLVQQIGINFLTGTFLLTRLIFER